MKNNYSKKTLGLPSSLDMKNQETLKIHTKNFKSTVLQQYVSA